MSVIDMVNGKLCEILPIEEIEQIRNESYNQALENIKEYILNSCNNVTCREDINTDNDFDFYASELLDMLEEIKEQK